MCGIAALISAYRDRVGELWECILNDLHRRGPNSLQQTVIEEAIFAGGVLHIQGDKMIAQPVTDDCGNILLWNGEVFGGLEELYEEGVSDTYIVSLLLKRTLTMADLSTPLPVIGEAVAEAASRIHGPYAFIFYHRASRSLTYGRDPFGRRSLLALCRQIGGLERHVLVTSAFGAGAGGKCTWPLPAEKSDSDDNINGSDSARRLPADALPPDEYKWIELSVEGVYVQRTRVPDGLDDCDGGSCVHLSPWPPSRLRLGRVPVCSPPAPQPSPTPSTICVDAVCSASTETEAGCGDATEDMRTTPAIFPSACDFLGVLQGALTNRIRRVHCLEEASNIPTANPLSLGMKVNDFTAPTLGVVPVSAEPPSELLAPATQSHSSCTIGVLFSGGVDSVLLAALLHLSLPDSMSNDAIDLINVTFFGSGSGGGESDEGNNVGKSGSREEPSPDRLAAVAALGELQILYPTRKWRLVHVDVSAEERALHEPRIMQLIQPQNTHMDLNIGTAFWFAARGRGYVRTYTSAACQRAYAAEENGRPLLRSGGEGARKGVGGKAKKRSRRKDKGQPEVDDCCGTDGAGSAGHVSVCSDHIVKVACGRPGCKRIAKPDCPHCLCKMCCDRRYRNSMLVVESCETLGTSNNGEGASAPCPVHRQSKSESMSDSPSRLHTSVIDAKKGEPPQAQPLQEEYTSMCKVLLVGIGADEQLAGYARHRSVYMRGGPAALLKELAVDTARIWQRNLGRDDRCVSDHGREAWFPFLDEIVVEFIQQKSLDQICDLNLPMGEGDKKILRDACKLVGLAKTADLVKRAIQFGTRVAKHTNVKFHGSNRKGKGTTTIDA